MRQRRRVCVVLVDRANYGRLRPVMHALQKHPNFELQVIAAGTMVLPRFDRPVRVVRDDGFRVDEEIYLELEGSLPVTMARSVGLGVAEIAGSLQRLSPDYVVVVGDRYEALSAAVAASYMGISIVHFQGGEVSGSLDENARHAITKLSHFHVPATQRAKDFVVRMGESESRILAVGCPSSDIVRDTQLHCDPALVNERGHGASIDPQQPFLLCVMHPNTAVSGQGEHELRAVLGALAMLARPTLLLWPNIDAGSDRFAKAIRVFRTENPRPWLRTRTNFEPSDYLRVLQACACAVGNSSSFIRDAGFLGTPVVAIGERQAHREHDQHVAHCGPDAERIVVCVDRQLEHGPYPQSTLYGDGHVASRFVEALAATQPYTQKYLSFVDAA